MSSNKKRKSDVNIDQVAIGNPKKEKWFDAEQTKAMLAAPLPDVPTTGRRSSFIGALKRMVSGSALRDKNRSMSKLSFSSSSSATVAPASTSLASVSFRENSFKENNEDASFASETSQESDHIPVDKLAQNSGLAKFVRRSETVDFRPSDSSFNIGSIDSLDASISSGSVFSLATPSRGMRRDEHRSSVRSMPESHLVEGLCLSAVRRNPSSVSDGGLTQSPLGKCRKSFRMLRKLSSSMAELPENAELNTSFAPLAEMDEDCLDSAVTPVAESMLEGGKTESTKKVKRTGSRLFGKKRNSISTPTDNQHGVSFSANGEDMTPSRGLTRTTPSSSGIHRKVSSALTKMGLIQNLTPTSTNVVVVKRTNTLKNGSRPDVSRRNSIATGFIRSSDDEALEKAKQEADLFRKQVRLADVPLQDIVGNMEFDAIIVDCLINGQPASSASKSLIDESDAQVLHRMVMLDPSKQQVIFKRPDKPTLICIKMDSPSTQPIDKRVRVGVGSGLREAFALEGVRRVLAYPMFCMNEEEWNDQEKCLNQLLQMVMHALAWNSNPDKMEYVVLAGLSPEHSALLKTCFDAFVANLPPSDDVPPEPVATAVGEEQTEVTETDL